METQAPETRLPDWEAFYRDYRKPGYVPGFEITTKLGGGMFGLVFRARKQSIGKDYAIKFLQVDDTEVRRAVLLELEQVKYFAQIDHPNLVSIEDRGEVDGIPYLVMSFAGTETLRDRIPSHDEAQAKTTPGKTSETPTPAEKDELLRYFLQCCRGLAALHERSLVHFDIKPANVFLKGAVARLGDYGLSKLVTHSRGSLSMGRGTPYYMAPEMLQRRGDHRSDIYSLGVMLYEILCGCVPFTGDSEWEVLKKHETETPSLPVHLTALECAVLRRCLQKDPAERFQSVHALIAAFEYAPRVVDAHGQHHSMLQDVEYAVAATAPPVPSCVPPPLPLIDPPPLPPRAAPKRSRSTGPSTLRSVGPLPQARRRGGGVAVVLLFVLLGGLMMFLYGTARSARAQRADARTAQLEASAQRAAAQTRRSPAASLSAKVDQFVATVQRSLRSATSRKRAPRLEELDRELLATVPDFHACGALVEALAKAPSFSAGHAQKLERHGRAAFLAGVASLQRLDYDDCEHCQRAANLHQFLSQVTAIDGMAIAARDCEPSTADTCRFVVVADGWRRFAEQFVANEGDYQRLLAAKGKAASVDR